MIVYYQIHSDIEISILQYKAQAINNITTIINYLLKLKNQLAYWFLNFVFYTFLNSSLLNFFINNIKIRVAMR